MTPRRWRCVLLLAGAGVLAGCATADARPGTGSTRAQAPQVVTAVESRAAADPPGSAPTGRPGANAAAPEAGTLAHVKRFRSVRGHAAAAPAASVRIPVIGVDSRLVTLGRQPDGTVEVPATWSQAGWFSEGPTPGQPGPAVILGHVDSRAGPAVFYRLHELRRGDEVVVTLADGSRVRFTVDRVERHAKAGFPSRAVYFPTLEPTLRLVTCGGEFDREAGSYRDNVIVFATRSG